MAVFPIPRDRIACLQLGMDAFRESAWLRPSVSGGSGYAPMNVFRKDDDFTVITEVPGIKK